MKPQFIRDRLKALHVAPLNSQMAEYWLSLSKDGELPQRSAFDPTAVSDSLRGCALFDVWLGERVICRIAGLVIKLTFGPDVVGKDWLEVTPARHRAQRAARYSAVAQGAIGVGRRIVMIEGRGPTRSEEVMLPFARNGDGSYPVLVHTDWRPSGEQWLGVDPGLVMTLADEFHLVELQ